ncbi:MAG: MaoC family dehydratase [Lachnospiraceae bacterium]|nr:MaoC family dehydratase [Lachnospiraceae bacterium]
MTLSELKVGDSGSFTKTISESDVYGFAGISGDFNPAHVNAVEASKGIFGERIAHGFLVGSLISTVVGTVLPGPGTIYMGQNLKFLKPVRFGDTVTATVTIREILLDKKRVIADTFCVNQNGETVISGEAVFRPPLP